MAYIRISVILCVLFVNIHTTNSECFQEPYPAELLECFQQKSAIADIHDVPGASIISHCLNLYLWTSGKDRWAPRQDMKTFKLVSNLLEKEPQEQKIVDDPNLSAFVASASGQNPTGRKLRVRREYRMLTERQRKDFHDAVNALRKDTSVEPNAYTALANFHRGASIRNAHGGANFLGWHRVYLYMLENALLEKVPTVIFPYWDSTIEAEMDDASSSYLFTDEFLGNADGNVHTGPFQHWGLVRNIGAGSPLFTKDILNNVLAQERHRDIIGRGLTNWDNDLEGHHGQIHVFVGGDVGRLQTASSDPVFFMLHNFIDYWWWMFREEQAKRGIDSAKDYPQDADPGHEANTVMGGFTNYLNIAGYANNWTSEVYTYERSPECPHCGGSKWLKCGRRNRCVAKSTRDGDSNIPALRELPNEKLRGLSEIIETLHTRDGSDVLSNNTCPSAACPAAPIPIQNTFQVDGKVDADEWDFMPIEIVNERPLGLSFTSFRIKGERVDSVDLFESSKNKNKRGLDSGRPLATFRNCNEARAGNARVFVNVDGLSYEGHSVEYAIIDDRLPTSSSIAYVPVKSPRNSETVAIFTANDDCGRPCVPMCRSENNPGRFETCSGVLRMRAGSSSPEFAPTVSEATNNIWQHHGGTNLCPTRGDSNICIKFHCDAEPRFPWERI